jgi:hypothetical protein
MTDIVEITLDNGKYKIIQSNTEFKALRYGEQWRDLTGDNLILFLVYEVESLRQQLADIKREWSIADSHKEDYAEKLERQLAECQQKLEMAEAVIAGDGALITGLKDDLAECQAREKVLRDALKESYDEDGLCVDPDDFVKQDDSTALDSMKKQWQREALLEAADEFGDSEVKAILEQKAKELE